MSAQPQLLATRFELLPAVSRAMTRCECAGVSFADLTKRMAAEGKSLETVMAETGVGVTCTGCLPDLRSFAVRFAKCPD